MSDQRPMSFRRYGRSYHLIVETAEDLEQVLQLDEALWVATGAPIETLNCDPTLLALVDSDRNGRILCDEMKDAIRWIRAILTDHSGTNLRSTTLKMAALNTNHEDGKRIQESHQSARMILSGDGAPSKDEITLNQVRTMKQKVEATPISETGVVLPEAAENPDVKQFIADILATIGGAPHPTGAMGVNQAQLDRFLAADAAYLEWNKKGNIPQGQTKTDIMALGTNTRAAFEALSAVRAKLDLYFSQCRAVELDARLAERMYPKQAELDAMNLQGDPAAVEKILMDAPPARPTAGRVLALDKHVNPYYADRLQCLRAVVVEPILGRPANQMTEEEWEEMKATFAMYEAWLASKPPEPVDTLGEERLAACLDPKLKSAVEALIAEGAKTAFVLENIRLTEKAVLYQAYILLLTNNFASFPDLYERKRHALFEEGTLVMDGRRFNLSVKVLNRSTHVEIAKTGSMFVIYVELTNRHDGRKKEVVMPVVAGGRGNINTGKRGLFIDLGGDEWDAQVVQVIENPISLIEAILSPFTRLGKMITGKIESAAAKAEQKLQVKAMQTALSPRSAAPAPTATPAPVAAAAPAAPAGGGAAALLMSGAVSVAALGAGATYISTALRTVPWWQIVIGLAAAIIVLLSPLMLLAILKLRKRDLSAILEGSGWAINARMRLTRHQAALFTQKPPYPKGAEGIRRAKWYIVTAIVVLLIIAGLLYLIGCLVQQPSHSNPVAPPTPEKVTGEK